MLITKNLYNYKQMKCKFTKKNLETKIYQKNEPSGVYVSSMGTYCL